MFRKQGAEEIGTQWIEVDKNEHQRNEFEQDIPPLYKSRLVALGNHEKAQNRSDSPTADNEVLCLVLSFAASRPGDSRSSQVILKMRTFAE